MLTETLDLYEGRDPRDVPAYSFREVALSIGVPTSTLRACFAGQSNFDHVLSLPADWSENQSLSSGSSDYSNLTQLDLPGFTYSWTLVGLKQRSY